MKKLHGSPKLLLILPIIVLIVCLLIYIHIIQITMAEIPRVEWIQYDNSDLSVCVGDRIQQENILKVTQGGILNVRVAWNRAETHPDVIEFKNSAHGKELQEEYQANIVGDTVIFSEKEYSTIIRNEDFFGISENNEIIVYDSVIKKDIDNYFNIPDLSPGDYYRVVYTNPENPLVRPSYVYRKVTILTKEECSVIKR